MSIYFSRPNRCERESEEISRKIDDFISSGGEIYEAQPGQSGYSWEMKSQSRISTARTWVDTGKHWVSDKAKQASVRRREINKEEQQDRKRRSSEQRKSASAQARALTEKERKRRDSLMPQIRKLLAEGKSRRQIAAIVDVTHGTINNWIRWDSGDE